MFKIYSQDQLSLLPSDLSASMEKDHLARLISRVIDDMDCSFLETMYSSMGQHAYHPKMLLKILVYGYASGIRSSRKLSNRLNEDIVFMWLAGRQTPDFRTISDFRKAKLVDVKAVFLDVLKLCQELGMIRIGKVSLDGTSFRADASGNKMRYRKILLKNKDSLEQRVDEILAEAEVIDREEEKLLGNRTEHTTGIPMKEVEKKLKQMKRRKATLNRNHQKLEARQSDLRQKLKTMRNDRNSMSSTDKDATMMLMKEGHIAPGYNAQVASEHQVILAYDLSSDRNDQKLLKPMTRIINDNTGKHPDILIADAGYGSKTNYRFLKHQRVAAFIPYGSFNREMVERRKGVYEPPKNRDTELERYKARQRMRLLSDEGKAMMKRRRQDVEPIFGDLKRNMNFRTFHLRGKSKCLIELGLVSIAHNLKKIKNQLQYLAKNEDGREQGIRLGTMLGYVS